MQLLHVKAHRFLGLGLVSLPLTTGGLTLVDGNNLDSTTAWSNGAGKSSLLETPFWALYGQTRRGGLKGDEVINRNDKGGALVVLWFEHKGQAYTLVRTRRYGKLGTALRLFASHVPEEVINEEQELTVEPAELELTKGTAKDSQEFLETLIGMNALTFSKAVYFGQGDVKPFASLTDGELKMVFEQSLNMVDISQDGAKVSGHRKSLESAKAAAESANEINRSRLASINNELATAREALAAFENDKAATRLTILAEADEIEKADTALREVLAQCLEQYGVVCNEFEAINKSLAQMTDIKAKYDDRRAEVYSDLARLTSRLGTAATTYQEAKSKVEEVGGKVGTACEWCGVEMSGEALACTLAKLQEIMDSATKEHSEVDGEKKARSAQLKQMEDVATPFTAKLQENQKRLAELKGEIGRLQATKVNTESRLADMRARAMSTKARLEENDARLPDNFAAKVARLEGELLATKNAMATASKQIEQAAHDIEVAKALEVALGNAGVKSLVFANVTPELNRFANDYLSILDPGMSVELSTFTKLKTGELREKFAVNVEIDGGAATFAGNSGGEKQKVNLAISLAFNRLMRETSSAVPNLLVLDEPFEALDGGSSEQVMDLLKALEVDNTWLITHNQDVKDLVPKRILVEKKDGLALIK